MSIESNIERTLRAQQRQVAEAQKSARLAQARAQRAASRYHHQSSFTFPEISLNFSPFMKGVYTLLAVATLGWASYEAVTHSSCFPPSHLPKTAEAYCL